MPKRLSLKIGIKSWLLIGYAIISFLITIIWFNSADLLVYTDTHFPFMNLEKYLERIFTIIDTGYFPSFNDIRHLFLYPYYFLFTPLVDFWSVQIASLIQRLILFSALFFSFSSISYLLLCISDLTKQRISYLAVLLSASLYCFNTYATIIIWRPFMPYILHYALFPLFIAFALRYFSTNQHKYLLALMILSFFIFPSYTILPSLAFDVIVVIVLLLSVKSMLKKTMTQVILTSLKIFSGILILSIPLILVALLQPSVISNTYEGIVKITSLPENLLRVVEYNSPSMIQALIYSGYPPLYTPDFSWYAKFTAWFEPLQLICISVTLVIGIISWTKRIRRNTRDYLLFGLLFIYLASLFMITGSNEPLSQLKIRIFQLKPFDMLRSVYARFGEYVVLSSLPFISLGLSKIMFLPKSRIYKLCTAFFLVLLLMTPMTPVLEGDFLKEGPKTPSNQIHFPNSYIVLRQLDAKEDDKNYLYLTIPSSAEVKLRSWNNGTYGYIGPDIFPFILSGRSIKDKKIYNNVLYFILNGKLKELQRILPIQYIILTFDQKIQSNADRRSLYNYLSIFQKEFETTFIDENLAIFKLPTTAQGASRDWRVHVLNQNTSSTVSDIFLNSYLQVISHGLPLETTYKKQNYITRVLDFAELGHMKIKSTVVLKRTAEKYYIFPIFLVLPKVTERLYIAAEYKPAENSWNIYSGTWSKEKLQWNYTLLTKLYSGNMAFTVDFERNSITVEDRDDKQEYQYPIPEEWNRLLISRLEISNKTVESPNGEIGIYATKNLTEIATLDELLVEMYKNNSMVLSSHTAATELHSTRIGPALSKISINTTKPFMLSFTESYDPLWEARIYNDGKLVEKVKPVTLYSVINGFWINETGNLTIEIRYTPQDWFEIGLAISAITFIGCIGYIAYDWKKNDERIIIMKGKICNILKKKK